MKFFSPSSSSFPAPSASIFIFIWIEFVCGSAAWVFVCVWQQKCFLSSPTPFNKWTWSAPTKNNYIFFVCVCVSVSSVFGLRRSVKWTNEMKIEMHQKQNEIVIRTYVALSESHKFSCFRLKGLLSSTADRYISYSPSLLLSFAHTQHTLAYAYAIRVRRRRRNNGVERIILHRRFGMYRMERVCAPDHRRIERLATRLGCVCCVSKQQGKCDVFCTFCGNAVRTTLYTLKFLHFAHTDIERYQNGASYEARRQHQRCHQPPYRSSQHTHTHTILFHSFAIWGKWFWDHSISE